MSFFSFISCEGKKKAHFSTFGLGLIRRENTNSKENNNKTKAKARKRRGKSQKDGVSRTRGGTGRAQVMKNNEACMVDLVVHTYDMVHRMIE